MKKKEFILNTPTLTATKWWPGACKRSTPIFLFESYDYISNFHLYFINITRRYIYKYSLVARTVTHALVMAQLWIRNRCYGPHLFILQVRSLDDHRPMPGITVGDIGSKIGYNSIDNGFMRMNNVRIPLDQMLMKHSKVSKRK